MPRSSSEWGRFAPLALTALAFVLLFWETFAGMAVQWWNDPDAGHALLVAPLAVYLAWKRGVAERAVPQPVLGLGMLTAAVLLRYVGGLAAELFTMRFSLFLAGLALVVMWGGLRQLLHWWLPVTLLFLSIPLPSLVRGALALPLQMQASEIGASLLAMRGVPVQLAGNVLHIPGQSLFVTEACSGLRSLTALLAIGVLSAGLFLRTPVGRIAIVLLALPVAVLLNGFRIFLTGFLVIFVDPSLGEGFMHYSEGWIIFVAAMVILGGAAWLVSMAEKRWRAA